MSKLFFSACIATIALAGPCQADTAFKGVAFITAIAGTCDGDTVGDRFNMTYHPFSVSGGTQTEHVAALNIFYTYGSQFNTLSTGNFSSVYKTTSNGGIGWSDYVSDFASAVLISKTTPTTLTATTPMVVMSGKIKNKDGSAGTQDCEISFDFSGVR
jgi:hypothetical protein